MPILDAALAFALTMLAVATVVSQIVRFLRNTPKLRSKELQNMFKEYFDKEFEPVVQRELNRLQKKANEVGASFLAETKNLKESRLFRDNELANLIEVSTEELTEKLKRSEFGATLLTKLGDEAQTIFNELGRRYEVVGDKFTVSFRKQSRWWATGVALVVALTLNIDSIHIARSYLKNSSLRDGVIAQMETIKARYDSEVASLKKDVSDSTAKALKEALDENKEQINLLKSTGFPIGWSYFPYAVFGEVTVKNDNRKVDFGNVTMWLLGVLLTAFFAGMGAPFWYDTVTGISRLAEKVRAVKKTSQSQ